MVIRKALLKDMPAILKLIGEYPDKLMQSHLPRSTAFFVATEDKKVVGCCALEIYSKRIAEIRSLAVTSRFQHRGIAKRLITACIDVTRRHGVYEVFCITGNPAFFKKHGFGTFKKERYALIRILDKE
jgi:amino-acid N-acetyltransferase